MLQRQAFQEHVADEEQSQVLTVSHVFDFIKRRAFYFAIPFTVCLTVGTLITVYLPATYLSQGTILVQSPQIPSDLVQPTVAVLANERVQIIKQRIMTRDNLLELAKKYGLSADWQGRLSGTDIVDFIKARTNIDPILLDAQGRRRSDAPTIAFNVGFEYEKPEIATRVANEIVTMLLNEDVRGRTNSATEATRFLDNEVKRLQGQIALIDSRITAAGQAAGSAPVDSKKSGGDSESNSESSAAVAASDEAKTLAKLKSDLLLKTGTLSEEHPDVRALKRRIAAFEKLVADTNAKAAADANAQKAPAWPAAGANAPKDSAAGADQAAQKITTAAPVSGDTNAPKPAVSQTATAVSLDELNTQKTNLNRELGDVTRKLAAARLGESLERGQFAERLQVIEQPTLPTKPVRPNRPKIFAIAVAIAFAAGGGLALSTEMLYPAIRRSSDLFSVIDSHLVVTIPYITTIGETRRRKRKVIYIAAAAAAVLLAGLAIALFILPPLDILYAKFVAMLAD